MKVLASTALAATIAAAALVVTTRPVHAELQELTKKVGSTTVHYKVVLPNGYDKSKAYPGILAFGGGPQTMNTVDGVLDRHLRAEAERRGYIVVAPAAPDGDVFFESGDRIFPDFLKQILADYKIENNKFHVIGPSNGGISAMHVAGKFPEYFVSVTAMPGFMWDLAPGKLEALENVCVFMYVGELDPYHWHEEMRKEVAFMKALGTNARYTVERGQPHRLDTLAGDRAFRLFNDFDEAKKGCRTK